MKKWLGYLRGGIGDMMGTFTQLPMFLADRGLTVDDFHWIVDSVYFNMPHAFILEKESIEILISMAGIKTYVPIPRHSSCANDLYFNIGERRHGIYQNNQYEFGFWRLPETKKYLEEALMRETEGDFLDCPYIETMMTWNKREGYKKINYENRVTVGGYNTGVVMPNNYCLIYFKPHGRNESTVVWEKIIDTVIAKGTPCVLIGKNNLSNRNSPLFIDMRMKVSFQDIMAMSASAPKAIMSGAGFAFQRLAAACSKGDLRSLFIWPFSGGFPNEILPKSYTANKQNVFVNSDSCHEEEIEKAIREII